MKSNYQRLVGIQDQEEKSILGLMSGTSMDGLDVALCRVSGQGLTTKLDLERFITVPHGEEYQEKVRQVFAKPDAHAEEIAIMDQYIAEVMALQIQDTLTRWNVDPGNIDLIASHGQTVYHNPIVGPSTEDKVRRVTIQLGDGDFLAHKTGIITISDFRQKHIAAGGEGAPLALYGDLLLFSHPEESRILLNIGGIANFTWLPAMKFQETSILCTDTGPGNTMIDAYVQKYYGQSYDRDAEIGRSGSVNDELLRNLLEDPFFYRPLPRTTGPELFNLEYLAKKGSKAIFNGLRKEDVVATLHSFSVESIMAAMESFLPKAESIIVSGGGIHNPLIMKLLRDALPNNKISSTDEFGVNPDAKEAIIFALLANECLFGTTSGYPFGGQDYPNVSMGKVSFP